MHDFRLDLANKMGATMVVNASAKDSSGKQIDSVQALVDANEGYGVDIILEMSGAPEAITTVFRAVRNGGTVVLFGIPSNPVEIDVAENMIFKNLTVRALNGRRIFDTWYKTRWLLEHAVVDLRPLVTRRIGFEEIDEAMEMLAAGQACKVVLIPEDKKKPHVPETRQRTEDPGVKGTVVHR